MKRGNYRTISDEQRLSIFHAVEGTNNVDGLSAANKTI
jgi:hypothetical protein